MPIKFPTLLQESWNFIRNHQSFSLTAILLIGLLSFARTWFTPDVTALATADGQINAMAGTLAPNLLFTILQIVITILLILNIQAINDGRYSHFSQSLSKTFSHGVPVLLLNLISVLPISIGAAFLVSSQLVGDNSLTLLAFPLLISGLYTFIKLNLVVYVNLLETPAKTIRETLKFTWGLSRGRMMPLILFVVLSTIVPSLISSMIVGLALSFGDKFVISSLVSGFFGLFITVFGFRFYQAYTRQ